MVKQGSIIKVNFNPQSGHEQAGYRPAVVISNDIFNIKTHMIIVCPVTSKVNYYPTNYVLEDTKLIHGSVLCEHIRSVDYESRNIVFKEKLSDNDLISVITLMNACIEE